MKRVLSLGILMMILSTIFLLGGAGSALASEDSTDCCDQGLFGTVGGVAIADDGTGTIELEDAEAVTVTPSTTYHIPGILPPWQAWEELMESGNDVYLEAGARIAVLLDENLENAIKVMVIPENRVRAHHMGVVTGVDGNTVTMMNKAGSQFAYNFRNGLPDGVAEGKFVTLVTENRAEGTNRDAVAACNTEQLVLRIQNHIEACEQTQTRDHLCDLLEQCCGENIGTLEQIRDRSQDQVREQDRARQALNQAIYDAEECYQEVLQLRERATTNASQE
jgi:hypothetical protein